MEKTEKLLKFWSVFHFQTPASCQSYLETMQTYTYLESAPLSKLENVKINHNVSLKMFGLFESQKNVKILDFGESFRPFIKLSNLATLQM